MAHLLLKQLYVIDHATVLLQRQQEQQPVCTELLSHVLPVLSPRDAANSSR